MIDSRLFKLCTLTATSIAMLTMSAASATVQQRRHAERVVAPVPVRPVETRGELAPSRQAALTDYRLSTSISPARFDQQQPAIRQLKDSTWLVIWQDDREGSYKIYGQQFRDDGSLIGGNLLIAESMVGDDLVDPKLTVDASGRVFLAWRNRTTGEIWLDRRTSSLAPDLGPLLVSDTTGDSYAGLFDLGCYPDGRLVIVWEGYFSGGNSVLYRMYDASTLPSFGPGVVHADVQDVDRWWPSVAIDPAGGFVVTWEDYRNGPGDIFFRQFGGGGAAIGTDVAVVPQPAAAAEQFAPAITYSTNDKFVIGWLDQRTGQEVYAQRFDPVNGLIGSNVLISSGDSLIPNWDVTIAAAFPNVIISYAAFGAANQICVRPINGGLNPLPVRIANLSGTGQRWTPVIQGGAVERYGIAWVDASDDPDIHTRVFNNGGSPLFDYELLTNGDVSGAVSSDPDVAIASPWWNLVSFCSEKRDAGDIWLRAIANDGQLSGSDQRVNQDSAGSLQTAPSAAAANGVVTIVWVDSRIVASQSGQRIFGRLADPLGNFLSNEFMISDATAAAVKQDVAISSSDQHSLVVWLDQRSGSLQVWGRWLNGSSVIGSEFQISSGTTDLEPADLQIDTDGNGVTYVAWLDRLSVPPTIRGTWYLADRTVGGSFSWSSTVAGVAIQEFSMAVHPVSSLLEFFWSGFSTGLASGYLAAISTSGALVIPPILVTDNANANASHPAIAVDEDGTTSLVWIDYRLGKPIAYARRYNASFNPLGASQTIASAVPASMADPNVAAADGRAWYCWSDPRVDGENVYAAVELYSPTDIDDPHGELPTSFLLHQNYPNPFNPSTTISFDLPAAGEVRLEILNLLGQTVRTLLSDRRSAGSHQVVWDGLSDSGEGVASGVYFYRLSSEGKKQSRKLLLVK